MAKKLNYTEIELKNAVNASYSIRQVLKALGLSPAGGNYQTIKRKIAELKLDTTHFRGQGWLKGKTHNFTTTPLKNILIKGKYYNSYWLKKRLIREGVKQHKCEECNNLTWQGQPIPLELHHKNGDRKDNTLENLKLLCPNCHAQTKTYRGRNMRGNKRLTSDS